MNEEDMRIPSDIGEDQATRSRKEIDEANIRHEAITVGEAMVFIVKAYDAMGSNKLLQCMSFLYKDIARVTADSIASEFGMDAKDEKFREARNTNIAMAATISIGLHKLAEISFGYNPIISKDAMRTWEDNNER